VTVAWLRRFSTRYSEGAVMVGMASCVIGLSPLTRYRRFHGNLGLGQADADADVG
jgi:hypothetical protein